MKVLDVPDSFLLILLYPSQVKFLRLTDNFAQGLSGRQCRVERGARQPIVPRRKGREGKGREGKEKRVHGHICSKFHIMYIIIV